jgi:hypothetical protein
VELDSPDLDLNEQVCTMVTLLLGGTGKLSGIFDLVLPGMHHNLFSITIYFHRYILQHMHDDDCQMKTSRTGLYTPILCFDIAGLQSGR